MFWFICWLGALGCLAVSSAASAGEDLWFLDLFSNFRPTYFVFHALSAVLALAGRRWVLVAVSSVGLALNGKAIAPHWSPSPLRHASSSASNDSALQLVTINLLHNNPDHSAVLKLLRKRQPDVVLLQEVSNRWIPTLRELSDIYPWQQFDGLMIGLGVLSRRPWLDANIIKLAEPSDGLGIAIHFDLNGQRVALLDIHGYHPTAANKIRHVESYQDSIIRWAVEQKILGNRVIVGGDFNCTPWSVYFRRFMGKTDLFDTSQGSVFGATRNVWRPDRIMIDHFFVSEGWRLLDREIGIDIGSDHRPVFIALSIASGLNR